MFYSEFCWRSGVSAVSGKTDGKQRVARAAQDKNKKTKGEKMRKMLETVVGVWIVFRILKNLAKSQPGEHAGWWARLN